ncbi:MAG: carboxypeptidase-like regulatory domain-containing protein [Patescibacteria group bacterium]|jgi:5-hydroxyisourate hydrolase-like protein (transthyretin family)
MFDWDVVSSAYPVFYGLFLVIIWALTRPVYADFRRRRSGYGVVFNSNTGEPVATAVIRLKTPQGLVAATVVTDSQGRYRLVAPKGEYHFEVSKAGFAFPSALMRDKKASPFFDNILASSHVRVEDYGTITKNIPLDPKWAAKKPITSKIILSKSTQHLLAFLGTGVALYLAAIQQMSFLPWVLFAIYLIIMLGRLLTFKPPEPPFGTITDAQTGEPLSQVVVRLLDKKFDKLIETQNTSPRGRYAFIVNRGAYRLMLEKSGYRKVIINFPSIKKDGFLLVRNVMMQKLS